MRDEIIDHNTEAEQELIGHVIHWGYDIKKVDWLLPEDMYSEEHQNIWKVILRLYRSNEPISYITVHDEARRFLDTYLSEDYLIAIYNSILTKGTYGIDFLGSMIKKYSIQRRLARGEEIDIGELKLLDTPSNTKEIEWMKDVIYKEVGRIKEGKHLDEVGTLTHYPTLDTYTGGLKKKDLIVIAGRPAMGKSSLAINLGVNVAKQNRKVLYINLEMSRIQIARKIISLMTKIEGDAFNRQFSGKELQRVEHQINLSLYKEEFPFAIVDAGKIKVEEIREFMKKERYDLVIIDQLTKVQHTNKKERYDLQIADTTLNLKATAKEFDVPIILLHQINRNADQRANTIPLMADLRDSGAVEQDADIILFIHREAYYNPKDTDETNTATIRVAKNKMGKTGDIPFVFFPEFSMFEERSFSK